MLHNELERKDGAYAAVHETMDEIMKRQRDTLGKNLMGHSRLPYLYAMPKFHKEGWRFIAGSKVCSTDRLSKILSDVLLKLMRTLRQKDDAHIRRTGIRRFFIVERFEEVSQFLARWKRTGPVRKIHSGDFSTMYTTIPHDKLFDAIYNSTAEAFRWVANEKGIDFENLCLEWTEEAGDVTVRWVRGREESTLTYSDGH